VAFRVLLIGVVGATLIDAQANESLSNLGNAGFIFERSSNVMRTSSMSAQHCWRITGNRLAKRLQQRNYVVRELRRGTHGPSCKCVVALRNPDR